jgi:hypothetical protein
VADAADDNRRYLPYGQVARPQVSLDRFDPSGFGQYGNWVFWEYLGERFGDDVVRDVWRHAAAYRGAPDGFSVAALRRALRPHGGLPAVFTAYAAALALPARSFAEGAAWPAAPGRSGRLGTRDRPARTTLRIDHLASRSVSVRPARSMRGAGRRLQVTVNAPARRTGARAYLQVVARDGTVRGRPIRLNADGFGRERVRFDARDVRRVTITLANASTRYRCGGGGPTYACNGTPRDQGRVFEVGARVVSR